MTPLLERITDTLYSHLGHGDMTTSEERRIDEIAAAILAVLREPPGIPHECEKKSGNAK